MPRAKLSAVPCFLSPVSCIWPRSGPPLRLSASAGDPYFFVPWCLGDSTPFAIAECGLNSRRGPCARALAGGLGSPRSQGKARSARPMRLPLLRRRMPHTLCLMPSFGHSIQNSKFVIQNWAAQRPLRRRMPHALCLMPSFGHSIQNSKFAIQNWAAQRPYLRRRRATAASSRPTRAPVGSGTAVHVSVLPLSVKYPWPGTTPVGRIPPLPV